MSEKSKFNPIVESLPLLKYMYIISYPLAKILAQLKVSPNFITTISNLLIVVAIFSLFKGSIFGFIILWILAEIFDICDGTVARINGLSSETGAFYDHFSDQVKIFLFFLTLTFYFDDEFISILSFIVLGVFFLYMDINKRSEILRLKQNIQVKSSTESLDLSLMRKIYNQIFMIHGHTMAIIPFMVLSDEIAYFGLVLFLIITLKNLLGSLRYMLKLLKGKVDV